MVGSRKYDCRPFATLTRPFSPLFSSLVLSHRHESGQFSVKDLDLNVLRDLSASQLMKRVWLSIGNFDGVHRGHQAMLSRLVARARQDNLPCAVLTFDPHPLTLIRPNSVPAPLTTLEQRAALLRELGLNQVIAYPTDAALLEMSPAAFFEQILLQKLDIAGLVEGPNFLFGHHRAGTVDTLTTLCAQANRPLEIVQPVLVEGNWISSSAVRQALQAGQVKQAADFLGRPYSLTGTVVTGAQRGRTLGFPTANLSDVQTLIPTEGVYSGQAMVQQQLYAAAINIGPNPTFREERQKMEIHLLDFAGDLYGQLLTVEFLDHLRPVHRFDSVDALKAQLDIDLAKVRQTWQAAKMRAR